MDTAALPARERILHTAHSLFYRHGIRAVGVDRLIAESGVAKLTFYRHFASKDDLVLAFLDYRHALWMAWFVDALGRNGASQGRGLEPLLAALAEWFASPDFRGCAFINAVVEVADAVPGVSAMAQRHKRDMLDVIADLLPDRLQGRERQAVACAVALAVDGAIVQAQMTGPADQGLEGDNGLWEGTQALDGLRVLLAGLVPASR